MLKPCTNCPFRSDHRFGLTKERCVEISDALLHDSWFPCHKTLDLPSSEKPCISAVLFVENVTGNYRSNVCFRLALRHIAPKEIDRTISVFDTREAFESGASF